jgi:hypothetical protein
MIPENNIRNLSMVNGNQSKGQEFTNKQLYTRGFTYNVVSGPGNNFAPNLGGKARFLHGITIYSESNNAGDFDLFSLTINSEVIVDKVLWLNYNGQGPSGNIFKTDQFYALPRMLSGSDSVQLNYDSVNVHKIHIVFYLSDVRPNNYVK